MNGFQLLWMLIELATSLFEIILVLMLMNAVLSRKPMHPVVIPAIALALTGFIYLLNQLDIPALIPVLMFFLIFLSLSLTLYKGSWQSKLLLLLIFFVIWGGSEFGTMFLLSLLFGSADGFSQPTLQRLVALVASKLVMFILVRLLIRIRLHSQQRLSWLYFFSLLAFPAASILSIISLELVWQSNLVSTGTPVFTIATCSAIALMFSNLLVFYLFDRVVFESNSKAKVLMLEKQLEYERRYLDNAEKRYSEIRRIAHDLDKVITPFSIYAEAGDLDKIQDAIKGVRKSLDLSKVSINSGNVYLDAILTEKIAEAMSLNIQVERKIYRIDGQLPLPVEALSVVLGNALDNAIEACEHISNDQKSIDILIRQEKGMFQIVIKNAFVVQPVRRNGIFQSIKQNAGEHGFGLPSIERIVEQYHGTMSIDLIDTCFSMVIIFSI